jgi:hypothetical protein
MKFKSRSILIFWMLSFSIFHTGIQAQSRPDSIWNKVYGGSADEPIGFGLGFLGAPTVSGAVLPDGSIYAVLTTASTDGYIHGSLGSEDVWVVKLNAQGDTLWTKIIGGTSFDRVYDMKATDDGGLVMVGRTNSNDNDFIGSNGSVDGFIAKLDSSGNLVFAELYGGSMEDLFHAVLPLDDGGYLAMGQTGSVDGDVPSGNPGSVDAWIVRLNADLSIRWSRKTTGVNPDVDYNDLFWDAVPHTDGYIICGLSGNFNDFNTDDILLVKYDSLGNLRWKTEIGSNVSDAVGGIIKENDNSLWVMGRVGQASASVSNYVGGAADTWLARIDSSGNLLNNYTYGGNDLDYAYGIGMDPSGNILLSGLTRSSSAYAYGPGLGMLDFWLLKINPTNGDTLANWRWGGSGNDYLHEVMFNGSDSSEIVVFGRSQSSDGWLSGNHGGNDLYVAKMQYATTAATAANPVPNIITRLYPNPTADILNIDIPEGDWTIEIYNISAVLMKSITTSAHEQIQIDCKDFSDGIYFIHIKGKDKQITEPFMINK